MPPAARLLVLCILAAFCAPAAAIDAGWPFDERTGPLEEHRELYLSSLRAAPRGQAGHFVSSDGLAVVPASALAGCAPAGVPSSFLAVRRSDEIPCPGLEVQSLLSVRDITRAVDAEAALASDADGRRRRREAAAKLAEKACAEDGGEAGVEELAEGRVYWAYSLRRHRDVRIAGALGRALALVRVYESGVPAATGHHLPWPSGVPRVPAGPSREELEQRVAGLLIERLPWSDPKDAPPAAAALAALPLAAAAMRDPVALARRLGEEEAEIVGRKLGEDPALRARYDAVRKDLERFRGIQDPKAFARRLAQDEERALRETLLSDPRLRADLTRLEEDLAAIKELKDPRAWAKQALREAVLEDPRLRPQYRQALQEAAVARGRVEGLREEARGRLESLRVEARGTDLVRGGLRAQQELRDFHAGVLEWRRKTTAALRRELLETLSFGSASASVCVEAALYRADPRLAASSTDTVGECVRSALTGGLGVDAGLVDMARAAAERRLTWRGETHSTAIEAELDLPARRGVLEARGSGAADIPYVFRVERGAQGAKFSLKAEGDY